MLDIIYGIKDEVIEYCLETGFIVTENKPEILKAIKEIDHIDGQLSIFGR